VQFRLPLTHNTSKIKEVSIGMSAIFACPPLKQKLSGLSYKWGNRYKNSSKDYDIKTSKRVWITAQGQLMFHELQPTDVSLFNKKGLRCIIEQKTSSGTNTIMSTNFKLTTKRESWNFSHLAFQASCDFFSVDDDCFSNFSSRT
jgi:hypothetical protein